MTVTTLEDGFDLNALSKDGTYSAPNAVNGPSSVDDYIVVVLSANVDGVSRQVQTLYNSAGAVYTRMFLATGWSAWSAGDGGAGIASSPAQQVATILPRTGVAGFLAVGTTVSGGTFGAATFNADSWLGTKRRTNVSTAATTTAISRLQDGAVTVTRGSDTEEGGFTMTAIFGYETMASTDYNMFVGVTSAITAAIDNLGVTSVSALNAIGIGRDYGVDSGPQVMHSNGTGPCTKVDLSGSFGDFVAGDVYRLIITVPAGNATLISVSLERINPGREVAAVVTEIAGNTANLPAAGTGLGVYVGHGNGGEATAADLAVLGIECSVPLL